MMRILVVRNDKIGDFMLAWPALSLLKHNYPDTHVTVLVPPYTAPLAEICPWVDETLIDKKQNIRELTSLLRKKNYHAMITLFSTTRIGLAGMLANIPYRLAPATKLAQIFYTQRQVQRRSYSIKPEYAYNLDIIFRFLFDHHVDDMLRVSTVSKGEWLPDEINHRPLLNFNDNVDTIRSDFRSRNNINPKAKIIFIHPGSGGSANNLKPIQYSSLCNILGENTECFFVITAGPGEKEIADEVANNINGSAIVYESKSGLVEFSRFIQYADVFVSGSTGPLHIAGALNICTAAFYPSHRSGNSLRWQTLNHYSKRLELTPRHITDNLSDNIDIVFSANKILENFLN